jgi:hypothetical protein
VHMELSIGSLALAQCGGLPGSDRSRQAIGFSGIRTRTSSVTIGSPPPISLPPKQLPPPSGYVTSNDDIPSPPLSHSTTDIPDSPSSWSTRSPDDLATRPEPDLLPSKRLPETPPPVTQTTEGISITAAPQFYRHFRHRLYHLQRLYCHFHLHLQCSLPPLPPCSL